MADPLISVEMAQARPGFDGADPAQLAELIDDASALVRDIASPHLDDTLQVDVPASIVPVVVSMVRRGLENPRGLSGEQLGDYGWQAQNQTSGNIYATRNEKRVVRRAVGKLGAGTAVLEGDLPLTETTARGVAADDLLGS